jgi:hypothetical protein
MINNASRGMPLAPIFIISLIKNVTVSAIKNKGTAKNLH